MAEDEKDKVDPRPAESEKDEEQGLNLEDRKKDYSALPKVKKQLQEVYQQEHVRVEETGATGCQRGE